MYNIIELLVWGKQSRKFKQPKARKLVIDQKSWDMIAKSLHITLPPKDFACTMQTIKKYGKEQR